MKLSIIVTAFNEEKYIDRCLKSLALQETHFDIEIIPILKYPMAYSSEIQEMK